MLVKGEPFPRIHKAYAQGIGTGITAAKNATPWLWGTMESVQ